MPQILFHFNAADKTGYAGRVLRKHFHAGGRVLVVANDPAQLDALDRSLWALGELEFIPHCREDASDAVRARTPIRLGTGVPASPDAEVLLNLGDEIPDGYDRFERVVEIVSQDDADRARARRRWMAYRQQGASPDRHDVASPA